LFSSRGFSLIFKVLNFFWIILIEVLVLVARLILVGNNHRAVHSLNVRVKPVFHHIVLNLFRVQVLRVFRIIFSRFHSIWVRLYWMTLQ
jgi:hypothetical protein